MKNKLFKRVVLLISTLLFILVLFLLPSTSCEKLDESFNSTDDINSTDSEACEHIFSKWKKTSIATCVREGKRIRICSKCETVETEIIEIQPHDGKLCRIVKPTCYDEGYSVYLCDCGYIYNSNYISALGHTLIKEQTVEKTCTTQGYTHYRCELCDYGITEDIVPPSHDFKVTVVRPTATASGFTNRMTRQAKDNAVPGSYCLSTARETMSNACIIHALTTDGEKPATAANTNRIGMPTRRISILFLPVRK